MYELERFTIEVVSAVACFVLVRFMVKPYQLTGENRYLGLPLGFGFLGISYMFSALVFSGLLAREGVFWLQLLTRAFAFLFLAVTYYFSKASAKNSKLLWNMTLGILIAILTTLAISTFFFPPVSAQQYHLAQIYVRIFNLICISYISIHSLKSHLEKPESTTLLFPLGYILLGIGQYSILVWAVDESIFALFGGLTLRLAGLAVFLYVSYSTFYGRKEGVHR